MASLQPPDDALLTVGHGTSELPELVDLLLTAGVDLLVDVRRYPSSRRHPHLAGAALASTLPTSGIAYHWEERLGGRRRLPSSEQTLDPWWTVKSFRGCAAYTRTAEFQAALDELLKSNASARVAIMCSESVLWRCHSRLISDVALAGRRVPVWHQMRRGRAVPHRLAAGARVRADGLIVWDRKPPADAPSGQFIVELHSATQPAANESTARRGVSRLGRRTASREVSGRWIAAMYAFVAPLRSGRVGLIDRL